MHKSHDLTFIELSAHFGEISAYGYLEQIERAAGISPRETTGLDPESRLSNALHAQDQLSAAVLPAAA